MTKHSKSKLKGVLLRNSTSPLVHPGIIIVEYNYKTGQPQNAFLTVIFYSTKSLLEYTSNMKYEIFIIRSSGISLLQIFLKLT